MNIEKEINMEGKISEKQMAANRKNATKSTGPKSLKGKRKSSMNSVTHGFYSNKIIIPTIDGEDAEERFEKLYLALVNDFKPVTALEYFEIDNLASCIWRKNRQQLCEKTHLEGVVSKLRTNNLITKVETGSNIDGDDSESVETARSLMLGIIDEDFKRISGENAIPDEKILNRIMEHEIRINREMDRSLSVLRSLKEGNQKG
jgi:hypothetical protein